MNAILRINKIEHEIIRLYYQFHCKTDFKGYPVSGTQGGSIILTLESTSKTDLLWNMCNNGFDSCSGAITIYSFDEDKPPLRHIEFEKASIYRFEEHMQAYTYLPMYIQIAITPLRMKIDKHVHIHREWPESIGGTWEHVKEQKEEWEKAPPAPEIMSVELLRGDDEQRGTVIQYVNLPKKSVYVDGTDVPHIDALGQNLKIKVKFDTPGVSNFKVKLVCENPANAKYSQGELSRNANFKHSDQEVEFSTDANGEKIINSIVTSPAGGDLFRIEAMDGQGNTVNASAKVETRRLLYYVETVMQGLASVPQNIQLAYDEFKKNGIQLNALPGVKSPYMHNISNEYIDTSTFIANTNKAYATSKGPGKAPYCLNIAYTDHLAVKGVLETRPVYKPTGNTTLITIQIEDKNNKIYPLWQNIVPGEDWFVECYFIKKGETPRDKIVINRSKCVPIQKPLYPQGYCDSVGVDTSSLPLNEGTITLKVKHIERMRAGLSFGNTNIVVVCTKAWWKIITPNKQCDVIVHEIGHQLGLVSDGKGILPDKSPYFYDNSKGHVGNHCHKGIPSGQKRYDSKVDLQLSRCVMYGSANGNISFCDECAKVVRKVDLKRGV